MTDNYEFEVRMSLAKDAEILPDILDLFMDSMEGRYSTLEFVSKTVDGTTTTSVEVTDPEDDDKRYIVDRDRVAQGLLMMLSDDGGEGSSPNTAKTFVPSIDSDNPAPARRVAVGLIMGEYDAGTIDAGDADCIVQLGIFGQVRYS